MSEDSPCREVRFINQPYLKFTDTENFFDVFMTNQGKVKFLIDSYNSFVGRITETYVKGRKEEYSVNSVRHVIRFGNIQFDHPKRSGTSELDYPLSARCERRTYCSQIKVGISITAIQNGKESVIINSPVPFGRVPVMLGSEICNLSKNPIERYQSGECPFDPLGYYVVNGLERPILVQESLRLSHPILQKKQSKKDSKNINQCRVTLDTNSGPKIFNVIIFPKCSDLCGHLIFGMTFLKNETFPAILMLATIIMFYQNKNTLRPMTSTDIDLAVDEIISMVKPEWKDQVLQSMAFSIGFAKSNVKGAISSLTSLVQGISADKKISEFDKFTKFEKELFPTPDFESKRIRKVKLLAMMIARAAENVAGLRELDNRDSWSLKRLKTSGKKLEELFVRIFNSAINKFIFQHSTTQKIQLHIFNSEAESFIDSFSRSNNWGTKESTKKENVTEILPRTSIQSVYRCLTKIMPPMSNRTKSFPVRLAQATQFGFIDPSDTPEGKSAGLTKELTSVCRISSCQDHGNIISVFSNGFFSRLVKDNPTDFEPGKVTLGGKSIGFTIIDSFEVLVDYIKEQYKLSSVNFNSANNILGVSEDDKEMLFFRLKNVFESESSRLDIGPLFIDGIYIGYVFIPVMKRILTLEKTRGGFIGFDTGIVVSDGSLFVFCDDSRPIEPLLAVDPISQEVIIARDNTWRNSYETLLQSGTVELVDPWEQENKYGDDYMLIASTIQEVNDNRKNISDLFDRVNDLTYILNTSKDLRKYDKKRNVSTLLTEIPISEDVFGKSKLASAEIENLERMISESRRNFEDAKTKRFTHCLIDPQAIIGYLSSLVPIPEFIQAPRVTYTCSMQNQAIGMFHVNHKLRFDTTTKILIGSSRSLFETEMSTVIGLNEFPVGLTVRASILPYYGYNQEDSVIMSRKLVELGGFRTIVYHSYEAEILSTDHLKKPTKIFKGKEKLYDCIDDNGLPIIGKFVREGDIIIGKVKTVGGKEEQDISIKVGVGEKGIIDSVMKYMNYIRVKIRDVRMPIAGDKFAIKYAQKQTVGLIMNDDEMPFDIRGNRLDIIINPHCVPSRMTISMLFEFLASKFAALECIRIDATAFHNFDIRQYSQGLFDKGMSSRGYELLFNGRTGEPMENPSFVGLVHYMCLRHQVQDKIQCRSVGEIKSSTHQPIGGRTNIGGLRIGEMEKDAFVAHGAASQVRERLCMVSDKYSAVICLTCGNLSATGGENPTCLFCEERARFGRVIIPYAFKLLMQQLTGANIKVTLKCKPVVSKKFYSMVGISSDKEEKINGIIVSKYIDQLECPDDPDINVEIERNNEVINFRFQVSKYIEEKITYINSVEFSPNLSRLFQILAIGNDDGSILPSDIRDSNLMASMIDVKCLTVENIPDSISTDIEQMFKLIKSNYEGYVGELEQKVTRIDSGEIVTLTVDDITLSVSKAMFNRLDGKIKSSLDHDLLIFCLLLRYRSLTGILHDENPASNRKVYYGSNHSIMTRTPDFVHTALESIGFDIELFSSPFGPSDKYFGLFPDIECHFGSLGRFTDISNLSGSFILTLPTNENLAADLCGHLNTMFEPGIDPLECIIIQPSELRNTSVIIERNKFHKFDYTTTQYPESYLTLDEKHAKSIAWKIYHVSRDGSDRRIAEIADKMSK